MGQERLGPSSKQPLMVRTFLKVYMEVGSYFLFLQEQIKDIIIIIMTGQEHDPGIEQISRRCWTDDDDVFYLFSQKQKIEGRCVASVGKLRALPVLSLGCSTYVLEHKGSSVDWGVSHLCRQKCMTMTLGRGLQGHRDTSDKNSAGKGRACLGGRWGSAGVGIVTLVPVPLQLCYCTRVSNRPFNRPGFLRRGITPDSHGLQTMTS